MKNTTTLAVLNEVISFLIITNYICIERNSSYSIPQQKEITSKLLELTMYPWAPSWMFCLLQFPVFFSNDVNLVPRALTAFDVRSFKGRYDRVKAILPEKRQKECKEDKKIPMKILFQNPTRSYFRQTIISRLLAFNLVTGTDKPKQGERKVNCKEAGK